jgi:elongation factor 3
LSAVLPNNPLGVHVLKQLPVMLAMADDRDAACRDASAKCREVVASKMSPFAVRYVFPFVLASLDNSCKFKVKLAALEMLSSMAVNSPGQLGCCLPMAVADLKGVLWDTKPEVCDQAKKTIHACFSVVNNTDITQFIDPLVSSMAVLEEVPETVHKLASTTFVQHVDACALSVVEPLLTRAFADKSVATKRQAAVIIENLSKLVEHAVEAAPFLEHLLPLIKSACDTTSDPEARGVMERVREHLIKMQSEVVPRDWSVNRLENAVIAALQKEDAEFPSQPILISYAANLAIACIENEVVNNEKLRSVWNDMFVPVFTSCLGDADKASKASQTLLTTCMQYAKSAEEEEEEDGDTLCNFKFTLAYGSKILLHNTNLKLIRGHRYGLLGGNDSGKSTLMRSMSTGQLDGFPNELRTVFVEADIQGEMSHLSCLEYIFQDPRIANIPGIEREKVAAVMQTVGFTEKMRGDPVTTLSGGWRMKLALSRAMLQNADILLLDEPTNHLDALNVAWVQSYLNSLKNTTCIMVSHDSSLLNNCCTNILSIDSLKLKAFKGNLESFVAVNPSAKAFFELKTDKFSFKFPKPGFLQGVNSKGKAVMKMDNIAFTYPGNDKPTISDVTVRVSLSSRVAIVGVNGAGKSTMIKVLTGELIPQTGIVWTHDSLRVAYVAQHAFHHIEKHLDKTPNEYIRWRYDNGEDKEALVKTTMVITDEDRKKLAEPVQISKTDDAGKVTKLKRVFDYLTGSRRPSNKGDFEYEVAFVGFGPSDNMFLPRKQLIEMGAEKHMKHTDIKIESQMGMYRRTLSSKNVEEHLNEVGLSPDYASHHRMSALSGGQKVKVVLAAAMWNQPHILILDEPTNYLDRDSLGALAGAIREYEGGVVMITHNLQFCESLCPETWMLEAGKLNCKGDAEWMKAADTKVAFEVMEVMTDALGNTSKVKNKKEKMTRKQRQTYLKLRKARIDRGEEVSSDEEE